MRDTEQENGSSGFSKEALRHQISRAYLLSGVTLAFVATLTTDHLRAQAAHGLITLQEKLLLDNFLQYTGNFKYGVALGLILNLFYTSKLRAYKKNKEEMPPGVEKFLTCIAPAILFTVLAIYNIDTETRQILPGSFGSPYLMDIPAGALGILFGSVIFEHLVAQQKKKV